MRACDARTLISRALDARPLSGSATFNVIAAGKAAQPMLDAFIARYGDRTREIVVARGGHPIPDKESFAAGEAALRVADANRARGQLLVVLLSGGASAMMAAPAPGVTLEDKVAMTRELLRSGLPIAEMNARRKQVSAIKGGKLALRAGRSITYAISDVHAPIEDDPAVIGSGPTFLRDPVEGVETEFVLAGSRRDAMAGAAAEAERLGYAVQRIDPPTLGEARDAANRFAASIREREAALLRERETASPPEREAASLREREPASLRARAAASSSRSLAVISSGETTVTLPPGSRGRGGRNQEFALAAALALAGPGPEGVDGLSGWALASIGTDGIDGPTSAAGAIVDDTTLNIAKTKGLDPRAALEAHDSYSFFEALGDLVVTGPTGTNVGDLQVFLGGVHPPAEGQ